MPTAALSELGPGEFLGVIDVLAWHEPTRSLLVIELKPAIADVNALLGTFDRKQRPQLLLD